MVFRITDYNLWMSGLFTAFGLGFLYFVGAIPAGVAAHAPVWLAAVAAWSGYSAGGLIVLLAGAPLRAWLLRMMKFSPVPDHTKLFWRIWHRFGIWGLGLVAPVTIGPQIMAALCVALGEPSRRTQAAIALGVIPWVIAISLLAALGEHALK